MPNYMVMPVRDKCKRESVRNDSEFINSVGLLKSEIKTLSKFFPCVGWEAHNFTFLYVSRPTCLTNRCYKSSLKALGVLKYVFYMKCFTWLSYNIQSINN